MKLWISALAVVTLGACNTVQGLGEDIAASGRAIEDAANAAAQPAPVYYEAAPATQTYYYY